MAEDIPKATRATVSGKLYVTALGLTALWGVGYLWWFYIDWSDAALNVSGIQDASRAAAVWEDLQKLGAVEYALLHGVLPAVGPLVALVTLKWWIRWLRRP